MNEKPNVVISACLLGFHLRYDGKGKFSQSLIDELSDKVNFIPVCPESEAGYPVPRKAVKLVREDSDKIKVKRICDDLDITSTISTWIERRIEELKGEKISAFIVKSKSPSCALKTGKLFKGNTMISENASGIFSKAVQSSFPDKLIIEETSLSNSQECRNFISSI